MIKLSRMSHSTGNICAGTQVVALTEVRGTNNSLVRPRGAVGVVMYLQLNCALLRVR